MTTDRTFEKHTREVIASKCQELIDIAPTQDSKKALTNLLEPYISATQAEFDVAEMSNNSILLYTIYSDILMLHEAYYEEPDNYTNIMLLSSLITLFTTVSKMYAVRVCDILNEVFKKLEG